MRSKRAGVFFREKLEPMCAHRSLFERNAILDNGRAAVAIHGPHRDLVFCDNVLGSTAPGTAGTAFALEKGASAPRSEGNRFENVQAPAAKP